MVTIEFPKEERISTKYKKAKECILRRELGENTSQECKDAFRNMSVTDD